MWEPGTKLVRKHNPEQGVGVVVGVEGRFIDVFFPDTMERMRLVPDPQSVRPIVLSVGDVARTPQDTLEKILAIQGKNAVLDSGVVVPLEKLWPVVAPPTLLERMIGGQLDPHEDVINRLDGVRLLDLRRQGLIPSLMGGRIEVFAHQLDTAARAIQQGEVRWLLADEVGLGKTIVAHMITSAMLRMGRAERVVVIAPDTLTVQWLAELYHKFHQVFVHIDAERLECVEADFGPGTNPFDVHPLAVVSYELLASKPALRESLLAAKPQLVAVDEAHRALAPVYQQTILSLVAATRHALLLTASPFQLGEAGFMTLAQALKLPQRALADGALEVRQVSAVTRADIPALPSRKPQAVAIEALGDLGEQDERVLWLANQLNLWRREGKKALIFVNDAQRAVRLHRALSHAAHMDLFMFHERMPTKERDIELSRFRLSASPGLVTSGAGSEGRNFQFCHVLVHVDLPADPTVLEQRIGRLDRIGREGDIPIYYFTHAGPGAELAQAYAQLGIFEDASVGSSPAMVLLRDYLADPKRDPSRLQEVLAQVRQHAQRHEARWSFPDSHRREEGRKVLAQVPRDLEALVERFCVDAAERTGLDCLEKDGQSSYLFAQGASMIVETIPGIPDDVQYIGTFSREEAITRAELEFFANGHPLVEGLLAELEDSPRGRVGGVTLARTRLIAGAARHLEAADFVLTIQGREELTRVTLYSLPGGRRPPEDEATTRAVLHALEHSKPLVKSARAEALESLVQSASLPGLDPQQLVALVLIRLTR